MSDSFPESTAPTALTASAAANLPDYIFCRSCGTRHPENTYRCVKCGTLLHGEPNPRPTVVIQDGGLSMVLPAKNPYSLWAYYCGVFSFMPFIGIPLAIIAVATGVMGIYRFKTTPGAKGILHSSGGLVLGLLSIVTQIGLIYIMKHIDFSFYKSLLNP